MRNGDLFPLRSTSCHGTTETGTRLAVRRLLVRNCTDHGTTHLCDVHLDLCDVDALNAGVEQSTLSSTTTYTAHSRSEGARTS